MSLAVYDYSVQLDQGVDLRVRHYKTSEPGPTLVLLHEALGNIVLWRDFPEKLCLATGLDVLVYERRGYGGSSPIVLPREDDYHEQEGKVWLPHLLRVLKLEKVILVGHSDGGSIALVTAAVLPDRVVGLVSMAAHIYVDHLTTNGIKEAIDKYNSTDLPDRLARYHGDRTDVLFRAWTETWLRDSFQSLDLRPWLPDIKCPALILQGANDNYGLVQQVTDIAGGIGDHAVPEIIPDCGHSPHLDKSEWCLNRIVIFIENCLHRQHSSTEV